MKKKIEKNKKQKEVSVSSETTGTEPASEFAESTITKSELIPEIKKVDKLSIGFPNEDLNKVVAKINEIIDKQNG